jgi:hypothetical protein
MLDMTIEGGRDFSNDGGGISNAGTLSVVDSTISGNEAEGTGGITFGGGGGIYNTTTGILTVTDSTISNNTGSEGGGGIFNFGIASIIDSTISGNSGGDDPTAEGGGGIYSGGTGSLTVTNCTITANSASFGSGIANDNSTLTVTDSTVVQNIALSGDGGITTFSSTPATLNGTIVARNTAPDIQFVTNGLTGSNDLIGDGSDVVGDTPSPLLNSLHGNATHPLNPLLSPLAANGGPTKTMAETALSPGIAHGANFPVLDASNGDITATDQRGVVRPRSSGIDIGAFQLPPAGAATRIVILPITPSIKAGATIGTTGTSSQFVVELVNAKGIVDASNNSSVMLTITVAAGSAGSAKYR